MNLDETFQILGTKAPDFGGHHVQMAKFQDRSYVAGPGARCVVWVSGCLRRCPGCFQPQFFDFQAGTRIGVQALAKRISDLPDIEGVTFSGGEPFEQSTALGNLCEILKRESDLTLLAYTGYRVADLSKEFPRHEKLLDHLDILIDGEYREDLAGPYLWRGSSNQSIHRRIPKSRCGDFEVDSITDPGEHQIQIALDDDSLVLTGFPESDVDERLRRSLKSRGILLSAPQHRADQQ